ncbi:glycosyl transferase, group 1 [Oscillochloris trichoides DG-6]|uniref:Glycosyl transferase, group 1 n=1 Tax=Oscillochloris trichoides DG-6 TaxID=765420 RepID=E1IIQ4_9CHLR|nr:glycosyltransferase [Oscillochloris trichoides]EFO78910.1 glycosyl transferase, group 1 [Oscillochloris trichoides DG-6]
MRVLFVCGREPEYVRNQIILKALHQHAEVTAITDSGKGYIVRHVRLLFKILFHRKAYDIVFVGFYGYLLIFLMRFLTRKPIIFDAYLSTYNTLCHDRKIFAPESLIGRFVFWMDRLACQIADIVVLDTRAHIEYFIKLYRLPATKFRVLYLGYDEELFIPRPPPPEHPFKVFYYGSFLPLQGIEHIVQAAKLLEHEPDIIFQIVGGGMRFNEIRGLAESLQCNNIGFLGWVPYHQLPDFIAQASICLGGHFSDETKAQNVIATKTYQFLGMARPTIVGDNPANAEIFTHGEHVYMCRLADPQSIADAILTLRANRDLREKIALGGYMHLAERYSIVRIGTILNDIIQEAQSHACLSG